MNDVSGRLAKDFKTFKAELCGRGMRYPEVLLSRALALSGDLSLKGIACAIGLSKGCLQRYFDRNQQQGDSVSPSTLVA